jgi:site-specific DNA-methyltransferase (adenine-specific)
VVLFGANHYSTRLPQSPCWLIWDKRDGIASNDNADCEMAWTNINAPARLIRHRWYGMIRASERAHSERYHPTQKPVAVMKWIIELTTKGGDTIFDPFMGSGTTGVACLQLGRNFIGCEIDPKYYAIAEKRIREAAMQEVMFK